MPVSFLLSNIPLGLNQIIVYHDDLNFHHVDTTDDINTDIVQLDDFQKLPYGNGVYQKILQLQGLNCKNQYDGWQAEKLPVGFRPGENVLYHGGTSVTQSHL